MNKDLHNHPLPHKPPHLFVPNTFYIITASTLYKQRFFDTSQKLNLLQDTLFEVTYDYGWKLQAWALFANHYHFIAQSPDDATTLKKVIQCLHSRSARYINELDHKPGRRVWYQYWDTCLTLERSYYSRLNYVHNNPVRHGIVAKADEYPFCSAAWFLNNAPEEFRKKVYSAPFDRVKIPEVEC